jgi:arylsulfatase
VKAWNVTRFCLSNCFLLATVPSSGLAETGKKPNILFISTDQQRFDSIAALGNRLIYTPNMDRLVKRGVTFRNAYATCPECVPSRYTMITGFQPPRTAVFENSSYRKSKAAAEVRQRCGPYLAEVMRSSGYRTFGIGKFHAFPKWNEDQGYDVHLHSEERYATPEQREGDAYARWLKENHPQFAYIDDLMGERGTMYYSPQVSPLPPELHVSSWVAQQTVKQIEADSDRPYFGFVSFIDPHPPLAPPQPFNRIYNPENMPDSICGDLHHDYTDDHLPFMNYMIWAENIDEQKAKILRARYYGEITFLDRCVGQILDAVEASGEAENTLICFFSDHGDLLGDHRGWQKESFFEASTRIPFLLSWPGKISAGEIRPELVCLEDLFAIATGAAGSIEIRGGIDVLGVLTGKANPREHLFGYYGQPGTPFFKMMVRQGDWKYIFLANGGYEQLFNLTDDPSELTNVAGRYRSLADQLRRVAVEECLKNELMTVLQDGNFKTFPFEKFKRIKLPQFDESRGIFNYPESPEEGLKQAGF